MAMAAYFAHTLVVALLVSATAFVIKSISVFGFTVDLYQRDSYGSPFYDPTLSEANIIRKAIARNINKTDTVNTNALVADLFGHAGEYLMKIHLGTPPVEIIAVADTGSGITWIQCQPCTRCIPQNRPRFNPLASSSYAKIPCNLYRPCPPHSQSRCHEGFCHHDIRYINRAYSRGLLSTETLKMDSTHSRHPVVEVPSYIFGCGNDNAGPFGGAGSGVIGLGAGPHSPVSQLGPLSNQRFSYCLIPLGLKGRVSRIHFGQDAYVQGHGTVTVPLVNKQPAHLYFVTLEAFTVGRTRIDFIDQSGAVEEGNIIIDSGSTITGLPRWFYTQIKLAVTTQTRAPPLPDPAGLLDLCFRQDRSSKLPNIVANFRGGNVHVDTLWLLT